MSNTDTFLYWMLPTTDSVFKSAKKYDAIHRLPCGHFLTALPPARLVIVQEGADLPLSFVEPAGVGVIRDDLRTRLEVFMEPAFVFDSMQDLDGPIIPGRYSYWTPHVVTIRGDEQSTCWRCDTCKQIMYFPAGEWYVVRNTLPDLQAFGSSMMGLFVRGAAYRCAKAFRPARVKFVRLPVLDAPLDGFSNNLELTPPEFFRKKEY